MTAPRSGIDVHIDGDALHLVMTGEVDVAVVRPAKAELDALQDPVSRCVVDLVAVTFLDSIGIGLLIEIHDQLGSVTLRGVPAYVRNLLHATGVSAMFAFDD